MKTLLAVLLLLSVSLNIWQWLDTRRADVSEAQPAPAALTQNAVVPDERIQPNPANIDISTLRGWFETGQYALLAPALMEALRKDPDNESLLLLEAELVAHTQPLSEAIAHYYRLLDMPLSRQAREDIEQRIDTLMTTAVSQLKQDKNWDMLAQFMEPLFQLMSTDKTTILALAEAYARQSKTTLMEDVLASLLPNDYDAAKIRAMVPEAPEFDDSDETVTPPAMDEDGVNAVRITLAQQDAHLLAILHAGDIALPLLLDTGASVTAISPGRFSQIRQRIRPEFVGVFSVETAAGTTTAPMYRLPVMTLGPYTLNDVSVMVLAQDNMQHAQGLLGMNILNQFNFQIDFTRRELVIHGRK